MQKRTLRIAVGAAALVSLTGLAAGSWMWLHPEPFVGKFAGGDPDQQLSSATTPGEGPVGGVEAFWSAARTYPADEIPPQAVANAKATTRPQRIPLRGGASVAMAVAISAGTEWRLPSVRCPRRSFLAPG